ncbi:MAG: hypothetical protein V4585_08230 [Bacteroidota bacterium]|jgi:hypothetical protein
MKAYKSEWSEHSFIQKTAETWQKKGFFNKEQFAKIQRVYPLDYYDPNVFLKIGLFIFTILATCFSGGIISALFLGVFGNNFNLAIIIEGLILGIVFIFLLENFIKSNKLYHSGVDNALLYMALSAFCTAIFLIFENVHPPTWLFLLIFSPLFVLATIRYADSVVCTLMYFLFFAIIISVALMVAWGKTFLPFIIMFYSIGAYFLVKKLSTRHDFLYYENCLTILKTLSLVTFYLGGNYLVVREGNALINNLSGAISPQVAFAPMFYFFTLIIPVAFIYFGLRDRDRLIMILGMITLAFSIFTYRYYFAVLPVEIALTLGGVLLMALAGGLIYYLRTNKFGFTYEPEDEREGMNLEALFMSQVIQSKIPQQGDTFRFGGGDVGGGGAGGEY